MRRFSHAAASTIDECANFTIDLAGDGTGKNRESEATAAVRLSGKMALTILPSYTSFPCWGAACVTAFRFVTKSMKALTSQPEDQQVAQLSRNGLQLCSLLCGEYGFMIEAALHNVITR